MTSDHPVKRRKKLIEVAIPLEAINAASAREKSIRHGHPSTLHLWWARRPLAAARAVIFCQMVDDPSAVPEEFPTDVDQENERLRLFALISELVLVDSSPLPDPGLLAPVSRVLSGAACSNTGDSGYLRGDRSHPETG
jgi:hypothetical protein